MELLLVKLASALILPPGGNLVLALAGLIALARSRLRLAVTCLVLAWGSLYAVSISPVTQALERRLQGHPPLVEVRLANAKAGAIVVLGGGRYPEAPEYGGVDTVGYETLHRVRYGAYLHRQTGLPLMVSGGTVFDQDAVPEAELMATTLREEFNVPVRWLESTSRTTAENASLSAERLQREGVSRVLLVTHATHMRRSVEAFERAGMTVTPAPTIIAGPAPPSYEWHSFLPSGSALARSRAALHEYLGLIW